MTSVFHARRRAEELAAVVDGDSRDRATHGAEVAELAGVVGLLRSQTPVAPSDDFAVELRGRLMLEAERVLTPETATLRLPARPRGVRERKLVAAASAFVLIGGTTTMAAAAQSALPGEALYPIKRGIEKAEVQLSLSEAGKGQDLLGQASDRLTEVRGLLGSDSLQSAPRVPATLESFSASAAEGSSLLFDAYRETGDPETIVTVRAFTAEGISALEALADDVPPEAQGVLADAALLLRDIDAEATELCPACASDLDAVQVPGIFLARAEVDRALEVASTRVLSNDHPVVVAKQRSTRSGDTGTTGVVPPPGTTGEVGGGQVEAGQGPAQPQATPLPEPGSWPSLLPDLTKESTGGSTKTREPSVTEKGGKSVESGLNGAVETLLPDPDGSLLD